MHHNTAETKNKTTIKQKTNNNNMNENNIINNSLFSTERLIRDSTKAKTVETIHSIQKDKEKTKDYKHIEKKIKTNFHQKDLLCDALDTEVFFIY